MISERESALKKQISDNLVREEEECNLKMKEIKGSMHLIRDLKSEIIASSQENEIDMLNKAKLRTSLCEEVNGTKTKDLASISINMDKALSYEIKRENELTQISKILHPFFKGNPAFVNTIPASTLLSHTASTANKVNKKGPPVQC